MGKFKQNKKVQTKKALPCKNPRLPFSNVFLKLIISKFNLNFIKIDCEDKESRVYVDKFNITEYPSIILYIEGKKYIYDANLNEETLHRFLVAVYEK